MPVLTVLRSAGWRFITYSFELADQSLGSDEIRRSYFTLLIAPHNQEFNMSFIDLDFFESPETVEHLLNSRNFEYKGHTWNDVEQGKVTGTIINVTRTGLGLMSTPEINWANGTRHYAAIYATAHSEYWSSRCTNHTWGYQPFYNNLFRYEYYDAGTRVYYFIMCQYYQGVNSKGQQVCVDPYGADKGPVYSTRMHITALRWADDGERFAQQVNTYFHTPTGGLASIWLPYTAIDQPSNIASRLRDLIFGDAAWRRTQEGYGFYRTYLNYAKLYEGVPMDLQLKRVNYDLIFPKKDRNPNWAEIAGEAYQSLGMADINGVANIKELLEFGSTVSSFAETLSKIPHSAVKHAAAAWLAVHYGFKLTLLDIKETSEVFQKYALKRSSLSKCQAVQNYSVDSRRYTARYQVFYDEFAEVDSYLQRLLMLTDSYLTTENMWDMVPWSFVVDWFISVGDVLQSLDNYANLMQKHNVICCGRSIKGTTNLRPSQVNLPPEFFTGQLVCTYYKRAYQANLVKPSLVPSVTINPFNHLIESAALYISIK